MSSSPPPPRTRSSDTRLRVGFALSPKKVETFIQPSLLDYAGDHGIDVVQIDLQSPLLSQGPFHCILHKISSPDWISQLLHFISVNPNIPIVDPPRSIEPLHSRISMLEVVNRLHLSPSALPLTVGIPKQVVVDDYDRLIDPQLPQASGLEFPLIAKAVSADGSSDSHEMSLVLNPQGLKQLKPPVVLQEFVNHGGVIFKVYVAGRHVKCAKRRSLPDVSKDELEHSKSILTFSQISNLSKKDADCRDQVATKVEAAELPPTDFVMEVASGLKEAIGLRLFNFDMIRDSKNVNRYLIIDINYFPGYAKVPGYEKMMTDFLLDVIHGEKEKTAPRGTE